MALTIALEGIIACSVFLFHGDGLIFRFHELSHSSTSLKLKLSRDNIKAVQGDTGHAEARMVTDTYAHGFEADRKLIAREMDSGFFAKVGTDQNPVETDNATIDLLKQLVRQHPQLLTELLKEANRDGK